MAGDPCVSPEGTNVAEVQKVSLDGSGRQPEGGQALSFLLASGLVVLD